MEFYDQPRYSYYDGNMDLKKFTKMQIGADDTIFLLFSKIVESFEEHEFILYGGLLDMIMTTNASKNIIVPKEKKMTIDIDIKIRNCSANVELREKLVGIVKSFGNNDNSTNVVERQMSNGFAIMIDNRKYIDISDICESEYKLAISSFVWEGKTVYAMPPHVLCADKTAYIDSAFSGLYAGIYKTPGIFMRKAIDGLRKLTNVLPTIRDLIRIMSENDCSSADNNFETGKCVCESLIGCGMVSVKNGKSVRLSNGSLVKHFASHCINRINPPIVLIGVEAAFAICDTMHKLDIMDDDEYRIINMIGGNPFCIDKLYVRRWKNESRSLLVMVMVPDGYFDFKHNHQNIIELQDKILLSNPIYRSARNKNSLSCSSAASDHGENAKFDPNGTNNYSGVSDDATKDYMNNRIKSLKIEDEDENTQDMISIQNYVTYGLWYQEI